MEIWPICKNHTLQPVKKVIKKKEFVAVKPIPKPPTVPVPFNLTMSSNKKQVEKKEEKIENVKEIKKPGSATPNNKMRNVLPAKKKRLEIKNNKLTVKETWGVTGIKTIEKPNSTTKTVPFSFDKRNKEKILEKQRKLEEEKEQKNKVSTPAASTSRKVLRSSTVAVSAKKVKDEGNSGKM